MTSTSGSKPKLDKDLTVVERQRLNYHLLLASLGIASVGLATVYSFTSLSDAVFDEYFSKSSSSLVLARTIYCVVLTVMLIVVVFALSNYIKNDANITQFF